LKINLNITFKYVFVLSLIWIIIDGILRKWFLFNLSAPLFYVKYILFGVSYTIFLVSGNPLPLLKKSHHFFIFLYIISCLIGLTTNSLNNASIVGIIGLVVHLFFLPLLHVTQFIFKNLNVFYSFTQFITYLSIPICILGMFQFYLPVDNILNGFVNEEQLVTRVQNFTRISSIFSFVKIYNAYLLFCITFLTAVTLNKLLNNKKSLFTSFVLLLLIINMIMTGSRLPLILMFINLLCISIYVLFVFPQLRKTIIFINLFSLLTIIILYFTTNIVKDPIDATIWRFETSESRHRESTGYTDVQQRIDDRLDIFKFSDEAGWFGYGIGMTYQGNEKKIDNHIPFYFEEEGERLVLEIGIIGTVVLIIMRLTLFFFAFRILKWCNSVEIQLILLALLLLITPPILTLEMTTFRYMENFFYYFSLGLIIALYKIHQKERNNNENITSP